MCAKTTQHRNVLNGNKQGFSVSETTERVKQREDSMQVVNKKDVK